MTSRLAFTSLSLLLMTSACGGGTDNGPTLGELDCPNGVSRAPFEPDLSLPGFENPIDALAILSWNRGTPTVESTDNGQVAFLYVDDGQRVGRAIVVSAARGWMVSELEVCEE